MDFAFQGYPVDTNISSSHQSGVGAENKDDAKIQITEKAREEVIDFWITLNSCKLELIREGKWKKR